MIRDIRNFCTTNIWLCLEEYYNLGMTPEQAKEVIESIPDPGHTYLKLRAKPGGINGNLIAETFCTKPTNIDLVTEAIRINLDRKLRELLAYATKLEDT